MTAPPRPSRRALGAALAVLLAAGGCSWIDGAPDPLPAFTAYTESAIEPTCSSEAFPPCGWTASGVLVERSVVPSDAPRPDAADDAVRLVFDGPVGVLRLPGLAPDRVPVEAGRTYEVAYAAAYAIFGVFPTLRLSDADGLAFYGTTLPGFPEGGALPLLDGWTVAVEPAGHGSRDAFCGVRATPRRVVVEHDGRRLRLEQGGAGRLGPYAVELRVAEAVDYRDVECTDIALPAFSLVVSRA